MSTDTFQLTTLYQDDDLLILNKPAGVVVNDAQTTSGETIQGWLGVKLAATPPPSAESWSSMVPKDYSPDYGTPEAVFEERQGMVHRLDKQTSGVLVWAKNPGALVSLLTQFKERTVSKHYLALVHGIIHAPKATLSYPLGRASRDRKLFAVVPDGRPAVTEYELKQTYKGLSEKHLTEVIWPKLQQLTQQDDGHPALKAIKTAHELLKRVQIYQGFSLLSCKPLTGRTHQIRVHLAHVRHPLVGDVTYVGKKRQSLDPLWCPRHFLHAAELELTHPRTGERMKFTAELSPDLQATLACLEME